MIAYLEGKLFKKDDDRIIVLVSGIGYEVLLPIVTAYQFSAIECGTSVSLHIFYYQSEHQSKPVLIGFINEMDREFFQYFISVETIGPLKAAKAFSAPVGEIARAIEDSDAKYLSKLKGIGPRLAQKIIASLHGKVAKFALIRETVPDSKEADSSEIEKQVMIVLVEQLGYKLSDAKKMISDAIRRRPDYTNPEDLFEEVYRVQVSK